MKAYVIVNVNVKDPARYVDYAKAASPTVTAHGGRYLARGGRAERLEGSASVNRIVVLEFPSYEQAKGWYDSPEYQAAALIRQGCSSGDLILVEGVP
jgi:uncharacterized protein (DUF1330 family)